MDHGADLRPTSGASAAELAAQLRETRDHTRRLTEDLSSAELLGPRLDIVNPVQWELGHCWATSARIARPAYRNFFTPDRNDVFAGFRTCAP